MMVEQSLLDVISTRMGCMYLSDLRFLSQGQRLYLAQILERMEPREEDTKDWNDALAYLANGPPEVSAQAAKERLIHLLSQPCGTGIEQMS